MDRDDYLLQYLPKETNEDYSCPKCGSNNYFTDSKTDELVCRDCFTKADPNEFHYHWDRYEDFLTFGE